MIAALVALGVVLVFAVARPHKWPEAVVAAPAAALLIGAGLGPLREAADEVGRLLPVVGFLAAVPALARLCDDEGVFRAAGAWMARTSAGNQKRLLPMVFGVAATTTAILSLDATVVLLTPVVLATVRTLSVPAEPHAYATAHLANSASLLLPVSNLTNLLAFTAAGLTGDSDANASRTTGVDSSATGAAACASPILRSHWCRGCVRIVGSGPITGSAGSA